MSKVVPFPAAQPAPTSTPSKKAQLAEKRKRWLEQYGDPQYAHTLYQEILSELEELEILESETRADREFVQDYILTAIKAGAQVEPGSRDIDLVPKRGGGFHMPKWATVCVKVVRRAVLRRAGTGD